MQQIDHHRHKHRKKLKQGLAIVIWTGNAHYYVSIFCMQSSFCMGKKIYVQKMSCKLAMGQCGHVNAVDHSGSTVE